MKKRTRNLIISLAVLAVFSGILIYFLITAEPKKDDTTSDKNASTSTETQISLINKNATDVSLIKINGEYITKNEKGEKIKSEMVDLTLEPVSDKVSGQLYIKSLEKFPKQDSKYSSVLKAVSTLSATKLIDENSENNAELETFGLKTPSYTVFVKFSDNSEYTLLIGNANPDNTGVYMKFSNKNEIYLSVPLVKNTLVTKATDFISTQIIPGYEDQTQIPVVNKFEFGGTLRDEKIIIDYTPTDESSPVGATQYSISEPIKGYTNSDYMGGLANGLFGIFASDIIALNPDEDTLKEYNFHNPYSYLALNYEGGSYKLNIGKAIGDFYYMMLDGIDIIYKVPKETIIWGETKLGGFHSKMLFVPSIVDVKKISIKTPDKNYDFELKAASTSGDDISITYNGEIVDALNFKKFYQVLVSTKSEERAEKITDDKILLELNFEFFKNTPNLNVKFFQTTARKAAVSVDGNINFQVSMTYVDKVVSDIEKMLKGETIQVEW